MPAIDISPQPQGIGVALRVRGEDSGYRLGDLRIIVGWRTSQNRIARRPRTLVVWVLEIGHRREIYR